MIINTLLKNVNDNNFFQELDFNPTGSIIFLVIGIIVFIITMIFVISFLGDDKAIAAFVGFVGMVIAAPFIVMSILSLNAAEGETKFIPEKVQAWANEIYLADLSDQQANNLIKGRIDYDKDNEEQRSSPLSSDAIAIYYGEKIKVSLSKYDGEWILTSADKELPRVADK